MQLTDMFIWLVILISFLSVSYMAMTVRVGAGGTVKNQCNQHVNVGLLIIANPSEYVYACDIYDHQINITLYILFALLSFT